MKYQVYVKKEIKSEADLPKKRDNLICHLKNGNVLMVDYRYIPNEEIMERIDWYLQPIELDLPDDINTTYETFKQWLYMEDKKGDTDYLRGFEDGLNTIAKIENQLK